MKTTHVVFVIATVLIALHPGWRQPAPAAGPQGIADQVSATRATVVHIERTGYCQGSGCIIGSEGVVFTAKHVVSGEPDPSKYVVTTDDGTRHAVRYVLEDTQHDVAFLLLDNPGRPLPMAQLADLSRLRVGDPVYIMGSPLGKPQFNSVSLGIVSAMQRNLNDSLREGTTYGWSVTMQSTSPAFPGNSGGPVFDMQGRVVGVLVAGYDATLNFSVPVAVFKDNVDTVRQWFALLRFRVPEKAVYDGGYTYMDSICRRN